MPVDFRDAFHFNSHIRLSLMAIIAIAIFGWLSFNPKLRTPLWAKIAMIIMSVFLLWVVTVLEVMSGLVILLFSGIVLGFFYTIRHKKIWGKVSLILLPVLMITVGFMVNKMVNDYHRVNPDLARKDFTLQGNPYQQLEEYYPIENGCPIGRNICWIEMKKEWNKRSPIPFDSIDFRGYTIGHTVLRYLNSLQLDKDSMGIWSLSETDIQNIEKGFANVEYTKRFSFKKRLYKLIWEYDMYKQGGDINGSSALKRLFLWETGVKIAAQNPWIGVGTGDIKLEFKNQLEKENSPLKDAGLRTHNQWISIAIAFGIPVFLYFVFALFYPMISLKRYDFLFMSFFVIYTLSMFWEDSLETQIGVTIFAFFYPYLLFMNPFNQKSIKSV